MSIAVRGAVGNYPNLTNFASVGTNWVCSTMTEGEREPDAAVGLPGTWQWSVGETSRPLTKRGYYLHVATRVVWENQYQRQYLEVRIDTVGLPPTDHVVQLSRRVEDYVQGDSWTLERLATEHVRVDNPRDMLAQRAAEEGAHEIGRRLMAEYRDESEPAMVAGGGGE